MDILNYVQYTLVYNTYQIYSVYTVYNMYITNSSNKTKIFVHSVWKKCNFCGMEAIEFFCLIELYICTTEHKNQANSLQVVV